MKKSTLIKMLIGNETPDSGKITIGDSVKIVSVGQERMDELDSTKTVFEEISEGLDEIELGTQSVASRAYLSWFGFKGQSQQAKVRSSHRWMNMRERNISAFSYSHTYIIWPLWKTRLGICRVGKEIVSS
jgi:ABC-type dipeptide/oligopeptide/nickel transport system ATPase subunit